MITVKKLALAIEKRLGHPPAQSVDEARIVMNYFGFRDRIIDNAIEPIDRKLFYALHDAGLVQSSWETVPLMDGRHWRIFYWQLDERTLNDVTKSDAVPPQEHVYQTLPEDAWTHSAPVP